VEGAEAILAAHPGVAGADVYTAAVLGDADAVRRFLAAAPESATAPGGPYGWDALSHLCFSNYLKLVGRPAGPRDARAEPERSAGFVEAARALLDAGASARTGFFEAAHQPEPEWESVLYGACGVAHHPGVTRLLLERGADPNDGEVTYHAPESHDNRALQVLLESGRLTPESLAVMLVRKADWHDTDGIRLLLGHGADPNRLTRWGVTGLHQAIRRDNAPENIELLLEHGADPILPGPGGMSAISLAVRRGRGDVLRMFTRRGVRHALRGADQLIAACALDDGAAVTALRGQQPGLVREVLAQGGRLLAEFAGTGNSAGVRHLLDLGVPVDDPFPEGDGYWDEAPGSTALHVAAWRARPEVLKLLLERGAAVNARDGRGRTPLMLAVKACVDSYWADRRSPDSVAGLLRAGANVVGVAWPSGYAAVDALLGAAGGGAR
jgi:hypothetical protein